MVMYADIQCPNCGGYRTEVVDIWGCSRWGCLLITGGLWLIVILIQNRQNANKPLENGEELKCEICGYNWGYGEQVSTGKVDQNLINKGTQRLEEEQKRRDDAYWDDYRRRVKQKKR